MSEEEKKQKKLTDSAQGCAGIDFLIPQLPVYKVHLRSACPKCGNSALVGKGFRRECPHCNIIIQGVDSCIR